MNEKPFVGYYLYNRMEGSTWQEIRLKGDSKEFLLQDLQCGTKYYCYIVAFNSAGRGNKSETISVKTDGNGNYYCFLAVGDDFKDGFYRRFILSTFDMIYSSCSTTVCLDQMIPGTSNVR